MTGCSGASVSGPLEEFAEGFLADLVLRAVQIGHARADLDGHRGVGYERRSKSRRAGFAVVRVRGVAAPSAGVKRRERR